MGIEDLEQGRIYNENRSLLCADSADLQETGRT